MKVLLLFPMRDRQTGLFIQRAMKQLGVAVITHDSRTGLKARIPALVRKHKPDFLLCNREHGLYKYMKKVRDMKPRPRLILWNFDKRQRLEEFGLDLLNLFKTMDTLYTVALGEVPQYRRLCPDTVIKHLQQGIDPLVHRTEVLTNSDHEKYDCDLMFAGSITSVHSGRIKLFDFLSKTGYQIKHYSGKMAVFDAEHNKACKCAKICLGHNGWPYHEVSMSVRDYKIMGAGGVLVTQ